jgi:F0F1-type ATP synthase assembly protein I
MNPEKQPDKNKKAIGVAMALGFELLSMLLVCIFAGYYLGKIKGIAEIGAIFGCILGFTIWTWRLIRTKRYLL